MGTERQREDAANFSWEAISSSYDPRYWSLGWELFAIQRAIIDRWAPDRTRSVGTICAPIAPLELDCSPGLAGLLDGLDPFPGFMSAMLIADGSSVAVLPAGTHMVLVALLPDYSWEGCGLNMWRTLEDGQWIATAGEGRYGCAATLADELIVPVGAPVHADSSARDRCLEAVREATSDFRQTRGLPPEGAAVDLSIGLILDRLARLSDADRAALTAAWDVDPIIRPELRLVMLEPQVQAACKKAELLLAQFAGDGSVLCRPDHVLPYHGAGMAAACALAVVLAGAALEATSLPVDHERRPLAPRWSRPWLSVFEQLPHP